MATILIAGGSGFIGQHLTQLLLKQQHTVRHLTRTPDESGPAKEFAWDLHAMTIDEAAFDGVDYIINLAGAGIADQRWSKARKALIISSRVNGAELLLQTAQRLGHFPKAYLAASAIGFYGDRSENWVSENSKPGDGFLAESTQRWEQATGLWAQAGVRTAAFRIGIVLGLESGALPELLKPLKFGTAPYFGDGKMWYSWIHYMDVCRLILFVMQDEKINGVINTVAPTPVRLIELIKALKKVTKASALLIPVPPFTLRMTLGEMADTVLTSTRVSAQKAEQLGFRFSFPELEGALQNILD